MRPNGRLLMRNFLSGSVIAVAVMSGLVGADGSTNVDPLVDRGRYLVGFGRCNDCHTPGWRESDGSIPVSRWMTGSNLGYRGPWGTSYPANVRLEFQTSRKMTGSLWCARAVAIGR